jgi:hypothetical protein
MRKRSVWWLRRIINAKREIAVHPKLKVLPGLTLFEQLRHQLLLYTPSRFARPLSRVSTTLSRCRERGHQQ